MPGKPRGEKFCEGLEVEYSPGDLRLVIHPSRGPWRTALRVFLILLPLPLLAFAPVQQAQQVYQHFASNAVGYPVQTNTVIKWLIALGFSLFLCNAGLSMAMSRRVRLTAKRPSRATNWASMRSGSAAEDRVRVVVKGPLSHRVHTLKRSDFFNLRIQPADLEPLPSGEHTTVAEGPGDFWLGFETKDYEPFAINLPVDARHLDRLASMIGEVFGHECRVVEVARAEEHAGAADSVH